MFTEVEFEWSVLVQPDVIKTKAHIHKGVILALLKNFNDVKCTPKHGYHVAVTTLQSIGEGTVWERRGCTAFLVRFRCVVFNLFPYEHVLAVVIKVDTAGIFCECGPFETLYIKPKHLTDYEFFSSEVGSLPVPQWRKTLSGATIKRGDVIRVKILRTLWDPAGRALHAVGSLLGDHAGVDGRWPNNNPATPSSDFGADSSNQWPEGGAVDGAWDDPLPNVDNIDNVENVVSTGWD